MLLDPYADPLWDTQPCPQRAAQQAAAKNRSLGQIFEATLKSRDHNVLMTALTGMYARLEGETLLLSQVSRFTSQAAHFWQNTPPPPP